MRDKLRRLKYRLKHDFLAVENVVLIIAIIMCLVWTIQSIEAMTKNWQLTDKLNTEKKQLELISVEVETAELENEYLKTDEYLELAARKYARKQLPGEHRVDMPENTEAAKNKHKAAEVTEEVVAEEKQYSNFEKWMRFLFP